MWSFHPIRTFCALIVMPRSRSMSMESRYWARMSLASTAPLSSRKRSASVDFPWSTCATIDKFRKRERSDTVPFSLVGAPGPRTGGQRGALLSFPGSTNVLGDHSHRGQHRQSEEAEPPEREASREQPAGAV